MLINNNIIYLAWGEVYTFKKSYSALVNNPKKTLLKLLLTIDFTRFLYNINTIITINIIIARTIPSSELMNSFEIPS